MKRVGRSWTVFVVFVLGACNDAPPETHATAETCASALDEASCEGIAEDVPGDGGPVGSCVWVNWVRTNIDPQTGACSFGEAEGRCEYTYSQPDGLCDPGSPSCAEVIDRVPVMRSDAFGISLGRAPICSPAEGVSICDDAEVPECACACDPGFPEN